MNKKIKLLYDATNLEYGLQNTPARSGIYFVVYNVLLEMLKREEFEVTLYTDFGAAYLVNEAIKTDNALAGAQIIKHSALNKLIIYFESLKYKNKIHNKSKLVRVLIKTILNLLKLMAKIKTLLNVDQYNKKMLKDFDVLFSPAGSVFPNAITAEHHKQYTILYDLMPMIFPENYPTIQSEKSWFYQLINSINEKDFYFSISEYTKNDYIKHVKNVVPEHIIPIPLATGMKYSPTGDQLQIDKVKEKYNIPKDKKYLFSLCTLEPRKNLIFAVKNFVQFIKKNKIEDFVFVLGGSYWDLFIERLNEAIDDLEAYKDKIIKIGYVDDEDMSALYSGAEMFVFPSIYEGFGIPVLEAMQCGCPVISSNATSLPEVIGDCGIQINPEDNEDLIRAFEKMYFDRAFRDNCINKGLERAKQFSWENSVDIIAKTIIKTCKPLVTIVTVTYNLIENNRKESFIRALESVHNQTYNNIEHLIIDGSSNDGTLDLIKEYADKGWIKYISEPDTGLYDAMNKSASLAQGKYILFLNSDDFFSGKEGVEQSVIALEKSKADCSYTDCIVIDYDGINYAKEHCQNKPDLAMFFTDMPFSHQTLMVKTEVFRTLGAFDTKYKSSADYDFALKLLFNKSKFVYIPYEFVTYQLGGHSFNTRTTAIEEVAQIYHKYYSPLYNLSLQDCRDIYIKKKMPVPLAFKLVTRTNLKLKFKRRILAHAMRRKVFRARFSLKSPHLMILGFEIISSKQD